MSDASAGLRARLVEAIQECRVSAHTAPWVEELDDGSVVRLELGRVNAGVVADAVLRIVASLEADRDEKRRLAEAWERNAQIQLAETLQALLRAGEAKLELAALRAKVNALSEAPEKEASDWTRSAHSVNAKRDAARRLRALIVRVLWHD